MRRCEEMAAEEFTEQVRAVLTGESPWLAKQRRTFKRIPSPPRCKLCAAPFAGLGGLILRHAGFRQSSGNPALCTRCIADLRKRQLTGVEIPITLLFSDIRGSTAMGERMRPADFHAFLDRFYRLASDSIVAHDGIVDKVVGDEVIGLFFGGITGPRHAVSLLGAEATRSATLELSAAFGNYFQAIEDRPETERDEARLAVVNVRRELLQAMRGELGVDEVVT
jgi:class 3 adenylate cyclase